MSTLDISKRFYNQDNCTITVMGLCKPIDAKLKESCLGTPLPYDFTSNGPIIDDVSHVDLQTWAALKAVPICWDKLKIFLCTVYVPECQTMESPSSSSSAAAAAATMQNPLANAYSQVVLPERGMCLAVTKACPLLFSGQGVGGRSLLGDSLPRFLQCDIYAPVCRQNKLRPKIFDANKATCQSPLVSTTNSRNWIKGIATCAFPCHSPVYRPEHYSLARNLVFIAAVTGIFLNVGVLCTLQLIRSSTSPPNRREAVSEEEAVVPIRRAITSPYRRLPYTALTFIHLAFLVGCVGFLMPHLPGMGETIACRGDGSVRVGEPQTQAGSPIPCVICFMLIYVPMLAVALWSNVLDYALFTAFHAAASRIDATTACVHRRPLRSGVWRLRRGRSMQPALLPPDSCELSKRRLGGHEFGDNEAMKRSVSPASPSVDAASSASTKKQMSSVQLEEKVSPLQQSFSRSASWKMEYDGNPYPPSVYRLLYSVELPGRALTNHVDGEKREVLIGQRATTFNSMGSEITCIHIAAFAIPVVFALISLTASEIDGEPLSGLCLVGVRTLWAFCSMVVAPLALCLLLKVIYLGRAMQSMRQLCSYLVVTCSPVDREMAHRFNMCFRAYVIYVLLLTSLLAFSAGVHVYAYVEEPKWLESQRLFLFSQLRHRLVGVDSFTACRTPFSTGLCLSDSPLPPHPPRLPLNSTSAFSIVKTSPDHRVRRNDRSLEHSSSAIASEDDADVPVLRGPLTGPILLNLFTYLIVNLVFASMCLLDTSVKVKWLNLLRRVVSFVTACPTKLTSTKTTSHANAVHNTSTNLHLPAAFSWWDPGLFFHGHEALSVGSVRVNNDDAVGNDADSVERAAANIAVATSDVSCGCNRRHSSSTNEECCVMSSVGVANQASKLRSVGRTTSSVVSSNAVVATAALTLAKVEAKSMHKSNSLNSSQSLFITHRGNRSRSSIGDTLFNPSSFQQGERVSTALEHNSARPMRRNRYRKMWVRKASGRRSLASRSYSALGLVSDGGSSAERRSLKSLLLHRAASSNGERILNGSVLSHQDISIESLSRLCATAAAVEMRRSRLLLDGGSQLSGYLPRDSTAASWTRRGGTNSRLSLASSSGAESYNSFQLLAEQSGATWRELWRTRLLLIDALHWAQAAVAASTSQNPCAQPPPPPPPPPLQSADQQQQLIAATSMMMAYLMGQQQPPAGGEVTPDSVMMAALVAATAAAQAAMQQSGQLQQTGGLCLSSLTPLKQMPRFEAPISTAVYPTSKRSQPDLLVDHHPIYHHPRFNNTNSNTTAVCHLDASTTAGISASPHLPLPIIGQHRLPLNPPPRSLPAAGADIWSASTTSPSLTHFSLPLAPPYAFIPPPPPPPTPPPHVMPSAVTINAKSVAKGGGCAEGDVNDVDDEDEGSDAFDSEDEVISTSGEEATMTAAVVADEYWEAFPTPEGQPSCAIGAILPSDTYADDISSVSQSASQIVVTTHNETDEAEANPADKKTCPKS